MKAKLYLVYYRERTNGLWIPQTVTRNEFRALFWTVQLSAQYGKGNVRAFVRQNNRMAAL